MAPLPDCQDRWLKEEERVVVSVWSSCRFCFLILSVVVSLTSRDTSSGSGILPFAGQILGISKFFEKGFRPKKVKRHQSSFVPAENNALRR